MLETQSSLLLDTREENRLPARVEAAAQWTIAMSINVDADALQSQLSIVAEHLIRAKVLGQKNLLNQLAFTHDVIVREMKLLASSRSRGQ